MVKDLVFHEKRTFGKMMAVLSKYFSSVPFFPSHFLTLFVGSLVVVVFLFTTLFYGSDYHDNSASLYHVWFFFSFYTLLPFFYYSF